MQTLQRPPRKQKLTLDTLVVDAFPTMPVEEMAPQAMISNNDSRCPSHPDSLCPCCTGPYLCG
jgi:hypothetical protein